MTVTKAAATIETAADEEKPATTLVPGDDVGVFLGALAGILRETVSRLEVTVHRVTEIVTERNSGPDRELVVTLQDFDRLQQEFVALSEALARFGQSADTSSASNMDSVALGRDAVAGITVADLKERLLRRMEGDALYRIDSDATDEVIF